MVHFSMFSMIQNYTYPPVIIPSEDFNISFNERFIRQHTIDFDLRL